MWKFTLGSSAGTRRSVPTKHERPSPQQMAKWRNLPGVDHWGLRLVVPRVGSFYEGLLSFFVVLPMSPVFSA